MKDKDKKQCCGHHIECGEVISASCVPLEIEVPKWSDLSTKKCLDVESVIQDIYDELTRIREQIDLKDVGSYCNTCIDYGEDDVEDLTVNRVLFGLERKICEGE